MGGEQAAAAAATATWRPALSSRRAGGRAPYVYQLIYIFSCVISRPTGGATTSPFDWPERDCVKGFGAEREWARVWRWRRHALAAASTQSCS